MVDVARSELILGGQRSGKSNRAEQLAGAWLAADPSRRAVMVATAQAWDEEMRERIAHHQGRVDLVLESELSNAPVTPSDCDIYLSGSPGMVYACVDVLERLGVGNERMFSDVFAYAPRPH